MSAEYNNTSPVPIDPIETRRHIARRQAEILGPMVVGMPVSPSVLDEVIGRRSREDLVVGVYVPSVPDYHVLEALQAIASRPAA